MVGGGRGGGGDVEMVVGWVEGGEGMKGGVAWYVN